MSNGATMSQACLWERNFDGTWTFRKLSEENWYTSNAMELNDAGQMLGWVQRTRIPVSIASGSVSTANGR